MHRWLRARSVHCIYTVSSSSPLNTLYPRFFYRTTKKNDSSKSAVVIGFSAISIFDSGPQYPRCGSAVLHIFRKPKFEWLQDFLTPDFDPVFFFTQAQHIIIEFSNAYTQTCTVINAFQPLSALNFCNQYISNFYSRITLLARLKLT